MLGQVIDALLIGLWFLFLAAMAVVGLTAAYCAFVFAYWVAENFAKWLGV